MAAHGVLIVTPVYWYQAPSVLKLMMDRLVPADGGNPDPTTTHGKKPEEAKRLEDEDTALQEEVRNAARTPVNTVRLMRDGGYERPDARLKAPRPK